MEIKIIDFGFTNLPIRKHYNDAGADVYCQNDYTLQPNQTIAIPLGFGLEIPDGHAGFIYPRSSLAKAGIICQLPPIDSGYRGEIHAIVTNTSPYPYSICKNDRIGQLVILPIVLSTFVTSHDTERLDNAFGSTGK